MAFKTLVANSLDDLAGVVKEILNDLPDDRIFAFYGKMGAGKTTFIKAFCEELMVEEIVSSPTFSLVNEYTSETFGPVFHFDFYRIKKVEEVYDIGYEEYFFNNYYCLIEWPELVSTLLPEKYVQVDIKVGENEERTISYSIIEN